MQFYLDADRGLTVTAYPVFLYGEDRVAPGEPVPPDLLRDARTENRAKRLLETYLEPETGKPGHYSISGEEALFQLLEEGIPALLAMGEVYQTDAFRNLQAAPPKISVGVSVHGSVLDLEVDTGASRWRNCGNFCSPCTRKNATTACGTAVCCGWMTVWKGWTSLTTRWSFPAQS